MAEMIVVPTKIQVFQDALKDVPKTQFTGWLIYIKLLNIHYELAQLKGKWYEKQSQK